MLTKPQGKFSKRSFHHTPGKTKLHLQAIYTGGDHPISHTKTKQI